ncbi:hypothetical protein BD770DRAFT_44453 [Pilaira anomala]|nr:hypothetical protein BD770DRAFT_44453 [Pilaira anomala]
MLPNSNEKVKNSFLKKGLTKHRRSDSNSSEADSIQVQSSFNLEKRGWLVEPSATPVVTPSRSLDTRKQLKTAQPATATIRKPVIKDISQKDILGAVSDEDIFKLTELTTRLPEITKTSTNKHYKNRSDKENDENITRKRKESVDGDLVTRSGKVISQQQMNRPVIRRPSFSSPGLPLLSTLSDMDTSDDTRRKSWLYKSLIKPYKSKSNNNKSNITNSSTGSNIDVTSEAASIAEEYYLSRAKELLKKDHTRSNSSNQQLKQTSEASTSRDVNRRHSFDSFQPAVDDGRAYMSKEEEDQMLSDLVQNQEFIIQQDEALAKWDEEQKQEV